MSDVNQASKKNCPCCGPQCGCGPAARKPGECCCGPVCKCGPDCGCGPECGCPAAASPAR